MLKNLLLIDGINRSGKNSIIGAITSLKKSESIEMNYIIEHIIEGLSIKLLKKKFAKSILNKIFIEIAYNKLLGRNSNFRKSDKSSIQNFTFPRKYLNRLKKKEGDHIFKQLKKSKNFFPFMTHEIFSNIHIFDDLKIRYKMICIFRNPFQIIFSWHKKKIIKKFGKKNFTLSFKDHSLDYPWYVYNDYKKWSKLNEYEKITFIIIRLLKNSVKNFKKIKNKKKFYFIKYEQFIQNPKLILKKICIFLNTKFSKKTNKKLKEVIPLSSNNFKKKNYLEKKIKKHINQNLYKQLKNLENSYNNNFYGLIH